MSSKSLTTVAQTVQQLAIDSNLDCETVETLVPEKAYDRMLLEAIGKLINLDEIVDRLQALDCQHCTPFTADQVKFAFLKWIENHLESIEMQPEWFIHRDFKHFERHLPELDGSFFPEEEYDNEPIFEEQAAQYTAELAATELVATELVATELVATYHQLSQLEDAFDGTPQQAAVAALDW